MFDKFKKSIFSRKLHRNTQLNKKNRKRNKPATKRVGRRDIRNDKKRNRKNIAKRKFFGNGRKRFLENFKRRRT